MLKLLLKKNKLKKFKQINYLDLERKTFKNINYKCASFTVEMPGGISLADLQLLTDTRTNSVSQVLQKKIQLGLERLEAYTPWGEDLIFSAKL